MEEKIMRCYGCGDILTDKEVMINTDEDFIDNKCLCSECLSWSNKLRHEVKDE